MADIKRISEPYVDELINQYLEVICGDNLSPELLKGLYEEPSKIQALSLTILTLIEAFSVPMVLTLIAEVHKICFVAGMLSLVDPNLETTQKLAHQAIKAERESLRKAFEKEMRLQEKANSLKLQLAQAEAEHAEISKRFADVGREFEMLKSQLLPFQKNKRSQLLQVTSVDEVNSYAATFEELSLSTTTFEELNLSSELLKGLYLEMKFQKPGKIQAFSLPRILTPPYKDLIAQVHNVSGKTTSFLLGMLCRVDPNLKRTQALCICPTKDLAIRNLEAVRKMGKYTGITSEIDTPANARPFFRPPVFAQIVIGTPGTLKNLMSWKKLSVTNLKVLVFDEVDGMLAKDGFQDDSLEIMKHIERGNAQCQVLLFSATFDETVKKFVAGTLKKDHDMSVFETFPYV